MNDHADASPGLMEALHQALNIFGNDASAALMFHLKRRLPGLEESGTTLKDIESALYDLLGQGAELLINTVRQSLDPKTHGTNGTATG